jgi:hypothetical protein
MPLHNNRVLLLIGIILVLTGGAFYLGTKKAVTPKDVAQNKETVTTTKEMTTTVATISQAAAKPSAPPAARTKALVSGNTTGYSTYNDTNNHFTIKYPSYVKPSLSFSTFHQIGNNWRLYASSANQGRPVIAFSIFNVDQGNYYTGKQTYPMYFTSEVRIGTSPNVKECYTPDAGYSNQKITSVTINGVSFTKFSTTDTNADKYTQSESYRTVRNGTCFVRHKPEAGRYEDRNN